MKPLFKLAAVARPEVLRLCSAAAFLLIGVSGCVETQTQSFGTTVETSPTGEVRFRSAAVAPSRTPDFAPIAVTTTPGLSGAAYSTLLNRTKVPGLNTLERRATPLRGTSPEALLRAAGPLPSPFEFLLASDLQAVRDSFGAVLHYAPRYVGGTLCVLALRPDPQGSGVMVLRNCVPGGTAEALAPLTNVTTL